MGTTKFWEGGKKNLEGWLFFCFLLVVGEKEKILWGGGIWGPLAAVLDFAGVAALQVVLGNFFLRGGFQWGWNKIFFL